MVSAKNNVVEMTNNDCHDLKWLLSTSDRDFLVRNNGDQVKIQTLKGKKVGLYFFASWCGPCLEFTPTLAEVYSQLSPKGDFEIVFVSGDENEEKFNGYFSKMPWLAIPFSDSEARNRLDALFKVMRMPHLVILDESGKVSTDDGVSIILKHGENAYPFTPEMIQELEERINPIFLRGLRSGFVIPSVRNRMPLPEVRQGNAPRRIRIPIYIRTGDFEVGERPGRM